MDIPNINFPDTIEIIEKKAPTDESIKLLNEFEEKARKNIIAKVQVNDNTLNGITIAYTNHHATASTIGKIYFKFSINGQEFNLEQDFDVYKFSGEKEKILYSYIHDEFKSKVANIIIFLMEKDIIEQIKKM